MPKWLTFCDKAAFVNLCALILLLPFSLAAVELFSTLTIIFFLIHVFGKQKLSSFVQRTLQHHLFWPTVILALAMFISVVFSENVSHSFRAYVSKFLQGLLTFIAACSVLNSSKRINLFFRCFYVSLLVVFIDAGCQFFMGKDIFKGHTPVNGTRLNITFPHSNDFGAYLCIASVFLLGMALRVSFNNAQIINKKQSNGLVLPIWRQIKSKYGPVSYFLLSIIALGLTYSRAAWFAAFLGMIGVAFFLKRIKLVLLVLIPLLLISIPLLMHVRKDIKTVEKKISIEQIFNNSGRNKFWGEAMLLSARSPLTGTGLNTYAMKVEQLQAMMPNRLRWKHSYYAHNCYLQMLTETGYIGLGAFLFFLGVVLRQLYQGFHHFREHHFSEPIIAVLFGVIAFLIQCYFDTSLYSGQLSIYFWTMLGVGVAMVSVAKMETK